MINERRTITLNNLKIAGFIIFGFINASNAQILPNKLDLNQNKIAIQVSMDPTPLITVGYFQNYEIMSNQVVAEISLAVPAFLFDFKHYRLELGGQFIPFSYGNWEIVSRSVITSVGTSTVMFDANNLGFSQSLLPGYYGEKWFITGEAGFTKHLITHLEHSEWYTDNVYPDAESGWYKSTGGKFDFGMQTGYAFNDQFGLAVRIGINKTETLKDPFWVPFYVGVSTDVSL